jgi:hypothetical protein
VVLSYCDCHCDRGGVYCDTGTVTVCAVVLSYCDCPCDRCGVYCDTGTVTVCAVVLCTVIVTAIVAVCTAMLVLSPCVLWYCGTVIVTAIVAVCTAILVLSPCVLVLWYCVLCVESAPCARFEQS